MMESLFYIASIIALSATILALTRSNAAHALIYLIVSLLAVAVLFFLMGAPFAAALEILIYAGAIMVLFVFVIMMLNLGESGEAQERSGLHPRNWIVPGIIRAGTDSVIHQWRRGFTQGSGLKTFRPLCSRGGTGLHVAFGRAGRRIPPGAQVYRTQRE